MKNKSWWLLGGLLLVIFGLTSLALVLVGGDWAFLHVLDVFGRGVALLLKILMVIAGFVLIILSRTDWEQEHEESQ